jgi:glycerate dehydrogenase
MLFYLMGHSRYYDEYVKSGEWQKSPIFTNVERPFFEVKGKTWGIIGLGEIGRGVARLATAFGADVIYYSTSGQNSTRDYHRVELEALLQNSDIISIHAPLNDATKDLIGLSELMQMKAGTILLNLGRGGIINEADLARVVDARELYVGLDVLETEPMSDPNPFMNIKNKERLYITPHIAWTSVEARDKLIAMVCGNIQNFIDGK